MSLREANRRRGRTILSRRRAALLLHFVRYRNICTQDPPPGAYCTALVKQFSRTAYGVLLPKCPFFLMQAS
jgi:hypothetical protein